MLTRISALVFAIVVLTSCQKGPGGNSSPVGPQGVWVSSGGELIKDNHNPWWLKNVSSIKYCVAIDQAGISASEDTIRKLVTRAISAWKGEFARDFRFTVPGFVFSPQNIQGVATQTFQSVNCDGKEDLRFQFGYGTLSQEQLEYLESPSCLVGVAVRTEYDEVQMRGRGFIYITSDKGPHHYDGDATMMDKPWTHETNLYLAILHELGHVFGIPHMGPRFSLMSAEFPEFLLNKFWEMSPKEGVIVLSQDIDAWESMLVPIFLPRINYRNLYSPEAGMKYFSLKNEDSVVVAVQEQPAMMTLTKMTSGVKAPLGRIDNIIYNQFDFTPVVNVVLNPKQTVFQTNPQVNPIFNSSEGGPVSIELQGHGTYYPPSGEGRPVLIEISAKKLRLYGIVDGNEELLGEAIY